MRLAGDLTNKTVCEVGCGTGFYTREFRKRTNGRVTGIDLSEGNL
jgi:ubiquinone/menaquinone biosynthesis C-methylase UbiE